MMRSRAFIYQIYYKESQAQHLDPEFHPLANYCPIFPEAAESGVFVERFASLPFDSADIVGFVSWKFTKKTTISGSRLIEFIESNPGYDVYAINPFPHMECFTSVWDQGEYFHKGITNSAFELLRLAGHEPLLRDLEFDRSQVVFCNYWAGTKEFWTRFIQFLEPVVMAYRQLPKSDPLFERLNQTVNHETGTNYLPYVLERLFPYFLALNQDLRLKKFEYSKQDLNLRYDPITKFFIQHARSGFSRTVFRHWVILLLQVVHCRHQLRSLLNPAFAKSHA